MHLSCRPVFSCITFVGLKYENGALELCMGACDPVLIFPASSRCRLRMYIFITVRVVLLVEETRVSCLSHTAGREVS